MQNSKSIFFWNKKAKSIHLKWRKQRDKLQKKKLFESVLKVLQESTKIVYNVLGHFKHDVVFTFTI